MVGVGKVGSQGSSNNGFMGLRIRKDLLVSGSTIARSGNVMSRIRVKGSGLVGKEGSSLVGRKTRIVETQMIFSFGCVGTRINGMITPARNKGIGEMLERVTGDAVNNV